MIEKKNDILHSAIHTLYHERALYAPETFARYSYLIANISHNLHDRQLPSNYRYETKPLFELVHRVPNKIQYQTRKLKIFTNHFVIGANVKDQPVK